ncbi:fibrillin-1-like isoform X3 [Octopus sinensis]|nr:fibrillin-1-like isoform X3 [Octopus sinensis]
MARSCDGYICICDSGFRHSFDRTRCVPASNILEKCDFSDNCPPTFSVCLFRQCVCRDGLEATENKTCRGRAERALGYRCNIENGCTYPNLQCVSGICQCRAGYRKKTDIEIQALPYDMFECITTNYNLNECNQIPLPAIPGLTSTVSPVSQSTVQNNSVSRGVPVPRSPNRKTIPNNTFITRLYGNCTTHKECPEFAECRPLACEGYVCICIEDFVPARNSTVCIKKSRLSEICEVDEQCPGEFSFCTNGLCTCTAGLETIDNIHCSVPGTSLHGYQCNSTIVCAIPDTSCRNGVCSCISGLRPKTIEEFAAYPNEIWSCIEEGFSLNECNHVVIPIPKQLNGSQHQTFGNTSLEDRCYSNDDCPFHADCQPRSCDLFICICSEGYRQSPDRSRCVKLSKLGESCNSDLNCPNEFAECTSGQCVCKENFSPVSDMYCKYAGTVVYGDACNATNSCTYPDTECNNRSCQCQENFREKTAQESRSFPELMFSCIKKNFSLNMCQGIPVTNLSQSQTEEVSSVVFSRFKRDVPTIQQKVKIYENCSEDTDCPEDASCVAHKCNDYRCVCSTGYQPSTDKNTCIRVAQIGQPCNRTVKCDPSIAECRPSGKCDCKFPLLLQNNYCALPNKLLLGENCTYSNQCDVSHRLYCFESSCQCLPGLISAPEIEKDFVFNHMCLPQNNSFDPCSNASSTEELFEPTRITYSKSNYSELTGWRNASKLNYTEFSHWVNTSKLNNNNDNDDSNDDDNNNNDDDNGDDDDNDDDNNNNDSINNSTNKESSIQIESLLEYDENITMEIADIQVSTQNIGSNCTTDIHCSSNSVCTQNSCGIYLCTCRKGFFEIEGLCRKVAGIGRECNSTTVCYPSSTECKPRQRCGCKFPFVLKNGFCVLPGKSLVNEQCTTTADCAAEQHLKCKDGICQCMPEFILVSVKDFSQLPGEMCIPVNSHAETCNGSNSDSSTSSNTNLLASSSVGFVGHCNDGSSGESCINRAVDDLTEGNKLLDHVLAPIAAAVLILLLFIAIMVYSRKKCNLFYFPSSRSNIERRNPSRL